MNNIKCHLDLKGSAPAEHNYSSIISYFGDGASWTIMEHIHRLLQRQQDHWNKMNKMEDDYHMRNEWFDSKFSGDLGIEDKKAKLSISNYAHANIWIYALDGIKRLNHLVCTNFR